MAWLHKYLYQSILTLHTSINECKKFSILIFGNKSNPGSLDRTGLDVRCAMTLGLLTEPAFSKGWTRGKHGDSEFGLQGSCALLQSDGCALSRNWSWIQCCCFLVKFPLFYYGVLPNLCVMYHSCYLLGLLTLRQYRVKRDSNGSKLTMSCSPTCWSVRSSPQQKRTILVSRSFSNSIDRYYYRWWRWYRQPKKMFNP